MCGIAPTAPWELVPLSIEGDRVEVFGSVPAMRGPVRLSLAEAEALSAALSAAGFSADDPLNAKLAAATSASLDAEELARTLHTETAKHDVERLRSAGGGDPRPPGGELAYQRDGADAPGERTVEPLQLLADRGAWYLSAWCREAERLPHVPHRPHPGPGSRRVNRSSRPHTGPRVWVPRRSRPRACRSPVCDSRAPGRSSSATGRAHVWSSSARTATRSPRSPSQGRTGSPGAWWRVSGVSRCWSPKTVRAAVVALAREESARG